MEVIDVRVGVDATALEADLAEALPTAHIKVHTLGDGVLLTGNVANPGIALRATAIAEKFARGSVTSMLRIAGSQVMLEVRVLEEPGRSTAHDIGLGARIAGSNFNFTYGTRIVGAPMTPAGNASHSRPASSATPRPTPPCASAGAWAMSRSMRSSPRSRRRVSFALGDPAWWRCRARKRPSWRVANSRSPCPADSIRAASNFRPYGVKLNFTPTVEDDGEITTGSSNRRSARIDQANAAQLSDVTIPALTVRRAGDPVELKDSGSLAIGGLFQRNYSNDLRRIPGLGDIPILSALFRSPTGRRTRPNC